MTSRSPLGEFEHLVLLAILQERDDADAMGIRTRLERGAERKVSRSAVYTTLRRLEEKGFVGWRTEPGPPPRGGIPRRRFHVTAEGIDALHAFRRAIARLSTGIEDRLRWTT